MLMLRPERAQHVLHLLIVLILPGQAFSFGRVSVKTLSGLPAQTTFDSPCVPSGLSWGQGVPLPGLSWLCPTRAQVSKPALSAISKGTDIPAIAEPHAHIHIFGGGDSLVNQVHCLTQGSGEDPVHHKARDDLAALEPGFSPGIEQRPLPARRFPGKSFLL